MEHDGKIHKILTDLLNSHNPHVCDLPLPTAECVKDETLLEVNW